MTLKQGAARAFESVTGWRWHVTMQRGTGEVYMDRWQLLKTRLLCVYVNHIRLPDEDPLPHNHPWLKSWSVKLRGRYVEEVWTHKQDVPAEGENISPHYFLVATHIPGRLSRIPENHHIVAVPTKGAWTLFIGWRSERKWGFIGEDGSVIPWKVRAQQRGMPMSAFSGGQNAESDSTSKMMFGRED